MTDDPRPPRGVRDADAHLEETRIDGARVFEGALLDVRRDNVRLPDGGCAIREYIVHSGAVLIVPVLADGRLVVERQFRYPLNRVLIEFPAGKLDPGESPLVTAQRELTEEAGYTAARWTRLGLIHPVVSYSTEAIELFVATGLTHVGRQLDHGEFLDVVTMTPDALIAALDQGEITDAKTITALLMYLRRQASLR
jgi:ADP-ribose pyrophosphatase